MRGAKKDLATTRLAREMGWLKDRRSFVTMPALYDGKPHLRLYGEDMSRVRKMAFERDEYKCTVCGTHDEENWLELDHYPVSRGQCGGDEISNVRTRCRDCHRARHNREVRLRNVNTEVA